MGGDHLRNTVVVAALGGTAESSARVTRTMNNGGSRTAGITSPGSSKAKNRQRNRARPPGRAL